MHLVIRNVRANPDPDGVPAHDDLDAIQSRPGLGAVRVERPGAQLGSTHPRLFGRPVATTRNPLRLHDLTTFHIRLPTKLQGADDHGHNPHNHDLLQRSQFQ